MAVFTECISEDGSLSIDGPEDLWGLEILLQKFSFFLKDLEI